jgi:glycosyltransferase involved in cell wall biosynthesis
MTTGTVNAAGPRSAGAGFAAIREVWWVSGPVSIVIPAHNEGAVVARGLQAILTAAHPGEFDVIVVSNGSTDDTAARARAVAADFTVSVNVLEIPAASKIAALRAAEELLQSNQPDVRIYLDADIVVDTASLRALAAAIRSPEPRLGLLRPEIDTTASSRAVRAYYRAWSALARSRAQRSGAGVLAVNSAGAGRICEWPDVLSDDGFVVRQFTPAETVQLEATTRVFASHSIVSTVKRRARIVNGNRELDQRWPLPRGAAGSGARIREVVDHLRSGDVGALDGLVYVAVTSAARSLAAWRRRTGTANQWSHDIRSRKAVAGRQS